MAASHPNSQYPQRIGEPDCRDYLRTGRCKYGESCKYNHPLNVESGGGIKTLLDPSEPPFPIRPGEPPCQYYLKHGTCKFGQTCKFHHPPHLASTSASSGAVGGGSGAGGGLSGAVMINVINSPHGNAGQQIYAVNAGEAGLADMQSQVLQLLPQRPGEPDCIYFLRNGRCKYGATCKYHHPIDTSRQGHRHQEHSYVQIGSPQSRMGRLRSASAGSSMDALSGGLTAVQFLPTSAVAAMGHGSYGQRKGEPTHILVSDGPIRLMAINQGSTNRNVNQFQQASNSSSPAITSTSVASSYETAVSSLDYITSSAHGQGHHDNQVYADMSGRYWRRTVSQEQLGPINGGTSPQTSYSNLSRLSSHPGGVGGVGAGGAPGAGVGVGAGSGGGGGGGGLTSGRVQLHKSQSMDADGGGHYEQTSSLRRVVETGRSPHHSHSRPRQGPYPKSMYSSNSDAAALHGQGGTSRWPLGPAPASAGNNSHNGFDRNWDDRNADVFHRSSSPQDDAFGNGYNLSSSAPEYFPDHSILHRDRFSRQQPPRTLSRRAIINHDGDDDVGDDGDDDVGRPFPSFDRSAEYGSDADEGLSKMTSALLTILDTQDGSGAGGGIASLGGNTDNVKDDNSYASARTAQSPPQLQDNYLSSGPSTPRQSGASLPRTPSFSDSIPRTDSAGSFKRSGYYLRTPLRGQESYSFGHQDYRAGTAAALSASAYIPSYTPSTRPRNGYGVVGGGAFLPSVGSGVGGARGMERTLSDMGSGPASAAAQWSPTWHSSKSPGRQMEHNAQSVSALQTQPGAAGAGHSSHIGGGGLFLS